jgi:galactose mutarotase-like enzyme
MTITISNKNSTAKINSKGAELNSLIKNDREYIWQGNPEFWGKHSPVLFPIVGTLKNDKYTYNKEEYSLSRHGFARDNEFDVIESTEESVTFSLKSSDETFKSYPFLFDLRISYALVNDRLTIEYYVKNSGDTQLPFSIGGHPAFALPQNFEEYSLKFENDDSIKSYFLENDLLSENFQQINFEKRELKLNYQLFENDALILKKMNSKSIEVLENGNPLFKFEFIDFPNFGIWTKKNAPFICLEPWLGYSDLVRSNGNILEKEGIVILEKNENFRASFSISIY